MKISGTAFFLFAFLLFVSNKSEAQNRRPLDLVFCLDLSGSTNGLINDVRDNLWLIVNQANHMQPAPDLRIGVVGFSRPSFGKNNAYVKVLCELTHDFDKVAAELFKLKPSIEKGDQIVSAALSTCVMGMNWTKSADAFKTVFICGNGMVTANGYEYVKSCEEAAERNIIINSLYIPSSANMFKELPAWRRIASITHGMQSELTVNTKDSVIVFNEANFERVREINNKLNNSYLWSGRDSSSCRKHQASADSGAFFTAKDAFFNRVYWKISDDYPKTIKDCELVNALLISTDATADIDGAGEPLTNKEFNNQLKQQQIQRDKFITALENELPSSYIESYYQKYKEGKMIENNIFERVVLNILFKQWTN